MAAWTYSDLYETIKYDLDWVMANWEQNGCDLWEEVRSNDFLWVRMGYVKALKEMGKLADKVGDSGDAYRNKAAEIEKTLDNHYDGNMFYEAGNRKQDGSVTHAIMTFGDSSISVLDSRVANTVKLYNKNFCL